MFAHSTFDPALLPECMSSEESCDEYYHSPDHTHKSQLLLLTRSPAWRSSRLARFYALLDAEDAAEQYQLDSVGVGVSSAGNKARRLPPRKERRVGPPKDGLVMPPQGVAPWMVSRRWVKETRESRPDLEAMLEGLIVHDTLGFEWDKFDVLGEESEDEMQEGVGEEFIPRSETSYSLAHALAPPT